MYSFSKQSKKHLKGVHNNLVEVAALALSKSVVDFGASDGLRTSDEQIAMFQSGKSWTVASKHLPCHCCGKSHAVDLYAWVDGKVSWDPIHYKAIKFAMGEAAAELGVEIKWGGDWTTKDYAHFELA